MWFVYALFNSTSNKIYVGETGNVEQRLEEHNNKRGNHYTAKVSGEWILVYKEEFLDRRRAFLREKQLKSFRGREFVRVQIINKGLAPR